MEDSGERIVVLETEMKALNDKVTLMIAKQESMQEQLIKYKGFIGGIAFLLSALVTAATIGKDVILIKLGLKQ